MTAYKGIQSRVKHVDKLGLAKDLLEKVRNSPYFSGFKGLKYFGKDIVFDSVSGANSLKGAKGVSLWEETCLKGVGKGSVAVGRNVLAGVDAATDTSTTVSRSLSTAGRVAHVFGFVASVVVLPLDICTLVTQSISFHRGTNEVEERIKELIAKLKLPEDGEITKVIEKCLRESLGNSVYDLMKIP